MWPFKELDEYDVSELINEILRRKRWNDKKFCGYCLKEFSKCECRMKTNKLYFNEKSLDVLKGIIK